MSAAEGRDFWDGAVSMTKAARKLHAAADITSPYAAARLDITVFVPCHDAEAGIVQTLETVVEAMGVVGNSYEILVIDDASKDRSVELVRGFMAAHEGLNIVMRTNKTCKGLACNYVDGAFMGCGSYYRMVDGEAAEPVETIVDIFRAIGDADIIVPYYISRLGQGRLRPLSSRLFTGLVNRVSGNRINCYTGAQVHLRYNVMRWHSDILGAAFSMDLLCRLLAQGFTYKQVPCRADMRHGVGGGMRNALSFAHALLNIALRRVARLVQAR